MLSVAIPTMNRWTTFLKKQFPIYVDHPKIASIVVCDETGHDLESICQDGYDTNPKVRLFQNETRLGIYGNKRQCLLSSSTEFVALLDSDNFFDPEFFTEALRCIERDGDASKKTVYCAGKNIRHLESGETEERIRHFNGMKITRDNWNTILKTPGWNFLLNNGNCIWPRDVVRHFPELSDSEIAAADSILAAKLAVEAGYTLSIEPTLQYKHMVHSDSGWIQTEYESSRILSSRNWKID
jgi:GT2 family glycosyltransferase